MRHKKWDKRPAQCESRNQEHLEYMEKQNGRTRDLKNGMNHHIKRDSLT